MDNIFESFIDDIDTNELVDKTPLIRQRDIHDYDFIVGVAFEDTQLRIREAVRRLNMFMDNQLSIKDHSEALIEKNNFPNGKYNFVSGYFEHEPIKYGFDAKFNRVRDVVSWLILLYGVMKISIGKMRICITDMKYGDEARFYRFANLQRFISDHEHVEENPRYYLQLIISLTNISKIFLVKNNLVAEMYKAFPFYDFSEYFRYVVRENIKSIFQCEIDDFETSDFNKEFEDKSQCLKFLSAYSKTSDSDIIERKNHWLQYNSVEELNREDRVHRFAALLSDDEPVKFYKKEIGSMTAQGNVLWKYITLILWPSETSDDPKFVSVTYIVGIDVKGEEPFDNLLNLIDN